MGGVIIRNTKALIVIQFFAVAAVIVVASVYTLRGSFHQKGMITGILYVDEDSTILIDGLILRNGDTLYGAKIIKIYRKKVKFDKNGTQWEQRIRERPNPAWKNDEKTNL